MSSDWDKLTPQQQAAVTRKRKLSGHTSVAEQLRIQVEQTRADAFDEAIGLLRLRGYFEASDVLEAAAFERAT